jgi:hypothetical protein
VLFVFSYVFALSQWLQIADFGAFHPLVNDESIDYIAKLGDQTQMCVIDDIDADFTDVVEFHQFGNLDLYDEKVNMSSAIRFCLCMRFKAWLFADCYGLFGNVSIEQVGGKKRKDMLLFGANGAVVMFSTFEQQTAYVRQFLKVNQLGPVAVAVLHAQVRYDAYFRRTLISANSSTVFAFQSVSPMHQSEIDLGIVGRPLLSRPSGGRLLALCSSVCKCACRNRELDTYSRVGASSVRRHWIDADCWCTWHSPEWYGVHWDGKEVCDMLARFQDTGVGVRVWSHF